MTNVEKLSEENYNKLIGNFDEVLTRKVNHWLGIDFPVMATLGEILGRQVAYNNNTLGLRQDRVMMKKDIVLIVSLLSFVIGCMVIALAIIGSAPRHLDYPREVCESHSGHGVCQTIND